MKRELFVSDLQEMPTDTTEATSLLIALLEALRMNGLKQQLVCTENLKLTELLLRKTKAAKWSNPSLKQLTEMCRCLSYMLPEENLSEQNQYLHFMNRTAFTTSDGLTN